MPHAFYAADFAYNNNARATTAYSRTDS